MHIRVQNQKFHANEIAKLVAGGLESHTSPGCYGSTFLSDTGSKQLVEAHKLALKLSPGDVVVSCGNATGHCYWGYYTKDQYEKMDFHKCA
jgi:hypothetical protein